MSTTEIIQQHEIHSLYHNHHNWLYSWLQHKLGDGYDAADLAHDTFIRVIVFRQTQSLGDEPRALLKCIAKGLVIDHWRRQEVRQAYLDTIAHLPEPTALPPEVSLSILEALYQVDVMLHSMSARTRQIFLLSQLDGLTYQEISKRIGISLATVKRSMRKAYITCLSAA